METMDLRQPQRHFKYPEGPVYRMSGEEAQNSAQQLLRMKYKCDAVFFTTLEAALKGLVQTVTPAGTPVHVACLGYPSEELRTLGQKENWRLSYHSRDPSELDPAAMLNVTAIYLAQPQWADGFFLPHENFRDLYAKLRRAHRSTPLFMDESLIPLMWSTAPAASSKDLLLADPNLWIVRSLFPALSPHEAAPTFVVGQGAEILQKTPRLSLGENEWIQSAKIIQAFERGEGGGYSEFQRRQLALRESVRFLTDYIRPLFLNHSFTATFWPESAFYLLLKIGPQANPLGLTDEEWVDAYFEHSGIRFTPGTHLNAPGCVRLCFAGSPRFLRKFGELLVKTLPQ